jgi:hypothetical protein
MRCVLTVATLLLVSLSTLAAGPSTIDNDNSCDISVLPAATLLLPYFEVDFKTPANSALTTIFTIQNTTAVPQIARVTLWTDWAYPMLTFNVFLTGYDVQGINLYDVFARGIIGSGSTSNATKIGPLSYGNDQNPHFLGDAAATCSSVPGTLDPQLLKELQSAFTWGTVIVPGCAPVTPGYYTVRANAVGYATIDVVANCNATSPVQAGYFTNEILFDNVLTGDVQHINPNQATGNYAGGNPLVHIRAIPEGGPAGALIATPLPYTFYDLYTTGAASRRADRRQPLPSTFMPRFIQGGTGAFNTNLQIWREASAAPTACPGAYSSNEALEISELIRFDEHENAMFLSGGSSFEGCCPPPSSPATSSLSAARSYPFPPFSTSGDVGGWLYLNLNDRGSPAYSAARDYRGGTTTNGPRQSQAWVVTSFFAEGRYAVEMDAAAVGNGCSPAPELSQRNPIGPAPNVNPAISTSAAGGATMNNDDSCDIALLPAATLLLPYFEVDFNTPSTTARTTIFTVQNTTAMPQIARVTLWTDWAYPMLTFNIFLTGYDLQSINFYDIFARGVVAPGPLVGTGGTSNRSKPGELSLGNDRNPHFLHDAIETCSNNPGRLDRGLLADLQAAFTKGTVTAPGCAIVKPVGGVHANAIGYATIDVVANCNPTSPLQPGYFTNEILFDNVLTGDYQNINPNPATGNYAGGNPLVHIRAVPEGGAAGAALATSLPYTFYDLYTTGALRRTQDRRQPLPSTFMPRFIEGGTGAFNTELRIWREAMTAPTTCPLAYDGNAKMPFADAVRFDEHENVRYSDGAYVDPFPPPGGLPAASTVRTTDSIFPGASSSGDAGGWLYLNLNNGGSIAYTATGNYRVGSTINGPRQSQAWVVTSMYAEGRFAVEMDAAAIRNGCSPAPDISRRATIGPAPNVNP